MGSTDARLNLSEEALPAVLDWFQQLPLERLLPEMLREIQEEALEEGDPVFSAGSLNELSLEFIGWEVPQLNAEASSSPAAEMVQTTYLWFYFRVHCHTGVLDQMKRSERIVFPTVADIKSGRCGETVLGPNLK